MSAEAAASSVDASAMVGRFRAVEYRVASETEAVPETATAYELKPLPAPEVRSRVAKALDVDESRVEVGAGGYDWYVSGVSSDTAVSSSPGCAPDERCAEVPPSPPTTVAGVPSAAEAERRVRDVLASLEASVDGRFEVFGEDGYNRTVVFTPTVGGVPVAGLQTQVAFGGGGRIEYANGLLADVEAIGDYPLVGLDEAVRRLQEGFGDGGVATLGAAESGVAPDPATTSAGSGGGAGSSAGSAGGGGQPEPTCAPGEACSTPPSPPDDQPTMTIEPRPNEPTVPLEPEVVEITGATLSFQVVATGCPGDPVYLVPAFELQSEPGPAGSIIAVEEDALSYDEGDDGGGPAEPCPGTAADVPAGKPEPAPLPADAGREPTKP